MCQRYYEKSFNASFPPTGSGGSSAGCIEDYVTSGIGSYQTRGVQCRVSKRGSTTWTIYSIDGTAGFVYAVIAGANKTANQENLGENSVSIFPSLSSADLIRYQWVASSEL